MRDLLGRLARKHDLRLTAVHVVDALHVAAPPTFISAALMSLTTMLRLELPHVNVLSKADLLSTLDPEDLPFGLQAFADGSCLRDLAQLVARPRTAADGEADDDDEGEDDRARAKTPRTFVHAERYRRLNGLICDVVDDFSLVSYHFLSVDDVDSLGRVLVAVDKANGYHMVAARASTGQEYEAMVRSHGPPSSIESILGDIEEKYLPRREEDAGGDDAER
eukprot:CAMPEP_0118852834 /NCGR_PEP_ID=MMETSP1163-20130328/1659_1 /TAXON_ID=124430 /ORGANISM="Phaeomonas parva, Strain CCMP2877" /LENGTH=220 /DNA_ID=CAMNT_0006785299 /DNA_START=30 /DNA_END=692 /DNA_ORIENTATION=+